MTDTRFCWSLTRKRGKNKTVALWITIIMGMAVKQSLELRADHPLHDIVDNVNARGSYIGLVMAFPAEEAVLQASGLFIPNNDFPLVKLSGRNFNIGTIKDIPVIYVMTGEQIVNAGVTVQILYDAFNMIGVVHYGIAGTTNASLLIGDVSIPRYVAFTGSWDWLENDSSDTELELRFGEFNTPTKGNNKLGEVQFTPTQFFSKTNDQMEKIFWFPVDSYWFNLSTQLKDVELQTCLNETRCLDNNNNNNTPKAVFGLLASTADVYLNNAAYGRFLFDKLNVSTVDEESAAVVMTSLSNGKPCVVFRGVSDRAGGGGNVTGGDYREVLKLDGSQVTLAAMNALNMAVRFIELVGTQMSMRVSM